MNTELDIRESLRKMRDAKNGKQFTPTSKKEISEGKGSMTMREMLGRMRKIKEDDTTQERTTTPLDKQKEEEKLGNAFKDIATPKIEDFQVFDNGVFLSGSIDDMITFTFSVSPSEDGSGLRWTATDEFNENTEEGGVIVKRLESYYNEFSEYWRENELLN